ncbi:MAG TPA: hypothetical protein VGJ73_17960 [Verrucomicrobiae bacterium]
MTVGHDLLKAVQRRTGTALFDRYIAAVIVGFFASIAALTGVLDFSILFESAGYPDLSDGIFKWGLLIVVGFAGVFAGSFCLPRKNRWIGSIVLLVLGVGFVSFWLVVVSFGLFIHPAPINSASLLQAFQSLITALPLAMGSTIAVVIHFLLRPKPSSS